MYHTHIKVVIETAAIAADSENEGTKNYIYMCDLSRLCIQF